MIEKMVGDDPEIRMFLQDIIEKSAQKGAICGQNDENPSQINPWKLQIVGAI